ncbi:hypothetical protein ABEV54_17385 [Peribacillus psychrosaccharolyticus]|uniref:hypothetical protein n=1 Tax=Peribacillus psychrosaccharolyticus TaxID=1407 RepID=UPI003D27B559
MNSESFRNEIVRLINEAKEEGLPYVDIVSGDVHRNLGGYPSRIHQMPTCCDAMYALKSDHDEVIYSPPKGKGATLQIRYHLTTTNDPSNLSSRIPPVGNTKVKLPNTLRGRSLHTKIIPTVCNLKNMLTKLVEVNGDISRLKQWEKRSYFAYQLGSIKEELLAAEPNEQIKLIRNHILNGDPSHFGASCIDIYLVAYVSETIGLGKDIFFHYIKIMGISDKPNSAQAIWQVGKGDGVYLGILNDNGTVRDWDFIAAWING